MTDKSFINEWPQMPFSAMNSQFDETLNQNLDDDDYFDENYLDHIFSNENSPIITSVDHEEEDEEHEEEEEKEVEEKEEDCENFVPKTYSWNHFLEGFAYFEFKF